MVLPPRSAMELCYAAPPLGMVKRIPALCPRGRPPLACALGVYSMTFDPTLNTGLECDALPSHQAVVFFFFDLVFRFVRTLGLSASMPALQISA